MKYVHLATGNQLSKSLLIECWIGYYLRLFPCNSKRV